MFDIEEIPLLKEDKKKFIYHKKVLNKTIKELSSFLEHHPYYKSPKFVSDTLFTETIKYNNAIEGDNYNITDIENIINNRNNLDNNERKRVINLYFGYKYILKNKNIDKEHLKELYALLSKDSLDDYSLENMGTYYRKKDVFVLSCDSILSNFSKGVNPEKIDKLMNSYFEYVNKDNDNLSDIDKFIKSQIMHLYFVYIHPYFDVNGRTGRTLSTWYLLNQEDYFGIIFNRAINFEKNKYIAIIKKSIKTGDITIFLDFMLKIVLHELKKDFIIRRIKNNSDDKITSEDEMVLEYYLSLKGDKTIDNLARFLNNYDGHKDTEKAKKEQVYPLVEKQILVENGILNSKGEMTYSINKKLLFKRNNSN